MVSPEEALNNLRAYAHKVDEAEHGINPTNGRAAYETRLDQTLQILQEHVAEQENRRQSHGQSASIPLIDGPSQQPRTRLQQLQTIKSAYEKLTLEDPQLLPPDSPLPALLALRGTQRVISETKESVKQTITKLTQARSQQLQEKADLRDAHLIKDAVKKRIAKLQIEYDEKSQKSPEEAATEMLKEQQKQKASYERDTKKLIKAFNKFIDEPLAGMLAAEELGGPVVGDLLDIDDEMLQAEFTDQGKAKKLKISESNRGAKRQRRIDEIWGSGDDNEGFGSERSERKAAAAEMRSLAEELLNTAAESNTQSSYVQLRRDSAAARFLVRAKVAQFHPKDARKLRLIDFGRELDD